MRSIVSLIFLFITLCAGAQTNVFGAVVSLPDSVGLGNCNISLLQGDSIVHTVVAEVDGGFFIGECDRRQVYIRGRRPWL